MAGSRRGIEEAVNTLLQEEGERLKTASEEFLRAYRKFLEEAKEKEAHTWQTASREAASNAEKALSAFKEFLVAETARRQNEMRKASEELTEDLRKEAMRHKEEQFKKVEESAYRAIGFISKEVLGHVISLEDHEKLVIRALQEAKKDFF